MQRRSKLKLEDLPAAGTTRERYRCARCGVRIPKLAKRPFICSYCADDPCHGTDGYYVDILKEWIAEREAWLQGKDLELNLTAIAALQNWRALVLRGEAHLLQYAEGNTI